MREAQAYKHQKQREQGKDLGSDPIAEWFKLHWFNWYRDCWVEHLYGTKKWAEFSEEDFDFLKKNASHADFKLAVRVLANLQKHKDNISENLGMIFRAGREPGEDMKDVISILSRLDINSKRPARDMEKIKDFYLALEEADRYKWIESQKAGKDLGEAAITEWFEKHWPLFAKEHGFPEDAVSAT